MFNGEFVDHPAPLIWHHLGRWYVMDFFDDYKMKPFQNTEMWVYIFIFFALFLIWCLKIICIFFYYKRRSNSFRQRHYSQGSARALKVIEKIKMADEF